jgi:flagellar basal-body rod modification protein FlgD
MSSISNLTTLTQNQFLQLLTTEFQNQDPTNPLSNQDLITQLSQVSTVSGIAQLNATFSQLLQLQQISQGTSLIGHTVTFQGSNGAAASGVVSALTVNNGTINLTIGNQSIPLSQITGVQQTTS